MAGPDKTGILLAPYGSLSPPALAIYEGIVRAYEKELPGHPVRLAFTSHLMKMRLQEKEGVSVPGLLGALEELQDLGCDEAVVQSLQIVPGEEFHQVAALIRDLRLSRGLGFSRLELGLPLLSTLRDCHRISSLLPLLIRRAVCSIPAAEQKDQDKEAVLLAGHGTAHPADAQYSVLARILEKEHSNIFLGSIEGSIGLEEILPHLKESGAGRVLLMPFLLVAGGHAEKDIFGTDPRSWKSILEMEGYTVRSHSQGLGDSPEIVSLFLEHTRSALEKMAKP